MPQRINPGRNHRHGKRTAQHQRGSSAQKPRHSQHTKQQQCTSAIGTYPLLKMAGVHHQPDVSRCTVAKQTQTQRSTTCITAQQRMHSLSTTGNFPDTDKAPGSHILHRHVVPHRMLQNNTNATGNTDANTTHHLPGPWCAQPRQSGTDRPPAQWFEPTQNPTKHRNRRKHVSTPYSCTTKTPHDFRQENG
jgi:hypothetical protein